MRMYAKYISVSTVQFEAYRQTGNNKIIDSQLALRLNNSRLIHGRAYFRPESASEIQVGQRVIPLSLMHSITGSMKGHSYNVC